MKIPTGILSLSLALTLGACGGAEPLAGDPGDEALGALEQEVVYLNRITRIRNVHTGKCMDIANGSRSDGASVNQYTCHGGPAQQFKLQQRPNIPGLLMIVNANSGKCVTPAGSAAHGYRLIQYPCSESLPNLFSLDRRVDTPTGARAALRWAYDSAYCIDVPGGSGADSLQLQLYSCHGGPNQTFDLTQ